MLNGRSAGIARRTRLRCETLESRIAPAFATFRIGDSGVTAQDAQISALAPTTPNPNSTLLTIAGESAVGGAKQALIRFDNLFGNGTGQIPQGATIKSAALTLWAIGPNPQSVQVEFHRMMLPWFDTTASWDAFGNGVQADDVESAIAKSADPVMTPNGWNLAGKNLVLDLQSWQLGNASHGWLISTNGPSWTFASGEDPDPTHRPKLTVNYDPSGYTNPRYFDLVGQPPLPTKLAWFDWSDSLREIRLARVPNARGGTFYFAQNGDDISGRGTLEHPWKTLAKAAQVLDESSGDVRLRFRRGDVWRETTTLDVRREGVTVDDYGNTALDKPRFSRFLQFDDRFWEHVERNMYKYVGPPDVGWLRETADGYSHIYFRAASSAAVADRPFSWFLDADGTDPASGDLPTLYVNTDGNPLDLPGGLEYCPGDGVGWVSNSDNVRFQNLRLEGQGVIASGQGYGLMIHQFGQTNWEFVGVGLEVYYTGYHSIGQIVQYFGTHAAATLIDCRAGLCVNRHGNGSPGSGAITVFVAYGDYGGNEYIQYQCEMTYGTLPSADWAAVPGMRHGGGMYSHIGGGGSLDLVIVTGTRQRPTENPLLGLNHINDAPPATTLAEVRGFIVEDQLGPVDSVWHNPNVALINCMIDRTDPPQVFNGVQYAFYYGPWPGGGWLINCSITIDARAQSLGPYIFMFLGVDSSRYLNCHIDIFNGVKDLFMRNPNEGPSYCYPTVFSNTIISLDTTQRSGLGLMNSPSNLQNNAYYVPRRDPATNWNYDYDAGAVTLQGRYPEGLVPSPTSPLYNGGLDLGLEYDQKRRPRGKLHGIGPLVGAPLPLPTRIEYGWANNLALLQPNGIFGQSGIDRIALTFPHNVDVRRENLAILGSAGPLGIASFSYNAVSRVATWILAAPLAKGRYTAELDGQPLVAFGVLPGDFNSDGYVNQVDFIAFRDAFGTSQAFYDLDGNGTVNQFDFIRFRNYFGTSL